MHLQISVRFTKASSQPKIPAVRFYYRCYDVFLHEVLKMGRFSLSIRHHISSPKVLKNLQGSFALKVYVESCPMILILMLAGKL
jgi:hypothetical protein